MASAGSAYPPGYPTHWEADVVLRDGGTAHIRPIRPDDSAALQAFHRGQSERSTYYRFFAHLAELPERDLRLFTEVDYVDRVALVAVQAAPAPDGSGLDGADGSDGSPGPGADGGDAVGEEQIIAVGRFDRTANGTAEVAFNVSDAHQGRGLGSVLLEHLAAAARERLVHQFVADVLPGNSAMLGVFQEAGYDVSQHLEDGVVSVRFAIDPTDRSLAVMADREHRAEARSMQGILDARSVLVLARGGSGLAAQTATRALLAGGFTGEVHLVGVTPEAEVLEATAATVRTWPELLRVPAPVDLILLDTPPGHAASTVRACQRLGSRAVVVLSGGYAENGPPGLALQRDLLRAAHTAGMRVVGPASYGVLRAGPHSVLNATLAQDPPPVGGVGLFCQSAAMAVPLLRSAARRRVGLSSFLSAGHRADVSGNDMMQFWQDDAATSVAGLYLESIGNPRKFSRVARKLSATKPVIVVTAGQSGHVVPAGHAVRPTRAPRRVLDEMLRQSGVIRAQNTHQMLDIAQLLAHQPLPAGRAVAILASSVALVALVAEAAASAGLSVVGRTAVLPSGAPEQDVTRAVAELYDAPDCDAVIAVHTPTIGTPDDRVARVVAEHAARTGRPTVACLLDHRGITPGLTAPDPDGRPRTVPAYATAEDAVLALAAATGYASWRSTDRGPQARPDGIDRVAARALVEQWTPPEGADPRELDPLEAARLLRLFGIDVWPVRPVDDAEEAVAAAEALGWPVALTSRAAALRHRADLGGVRLDISDAATLRAQVMRMGEHLARIGAQVDGPAYEVQPMAPTGVACVVRSEEDPLFGPVVSFGLSGDAVDLLGDIGYGIPPFTTQDVADLVRSPRAAPRLFGYRGLPAMDTAALEDLLARVAEMSDALPELRRVVLHPVVVHEAGLSVLAGRVHLARAGRADATRRTLPG